MLPNLIDLILISRCQRDLAEQESDDSYLQYQFRSRGMRPAHALPRLRDPIRTTAIRRPVDDSDG